MNNELLFKVEFFYFIYSTTSLLDFVCSIMTGEYVFAKSNIKLIFSDKTSMIILPDNVQKYAAKSSKGTIMKAN